MILKKTANRLVSTALPLAFLVLYGGGILLLTNTAHNGGRLVHEFGVRAAVKPSPVPAGEQEANKTGAAAGDSQAERRSRLKIDSAALMQVSEHLSPGGIMYAFKLIRLIESRAEHLSEGLIHKLTEQ